MSAKIEMTGVREFQKALRQIDRDIPKQLRIVFNSAAGLVVDYARPRIPTRTGAAAASVKVRSTQRTAGVAVGGRRAPYFPWLDFGGEGRIKGRPAKRPFRKEGRYVYPGLEANRQEITDVMAAGLARLARDAGLEVT